MTPAEANEREAFAAIGRLGEHEFERVRCWIASGCEGPQPRPDEAQRRALNDRLMTAIAAREGTAHG